MSDQLYFEDFTVGDSFASPSRTIGEAHFLAFAGLTGDNYQQIVALPPACRYKRSRWVFLATKSDDFARVFLPFCSGGNVLHLISDKRDELGRLCERYRVRRLELFGSAAGEGFEPERSDLDFLVEFLALPSGRHADTYFGLLEDLQALFGRPIDLVMVGAIRNPFFLQGISGSRQILYAA